MWQYDPNAGDMVWVDDSAQDTENSLFYSPRRFDNALFMPPAAVSAPAPAPAVSTQAQQSSGVPTAEQILTQGGGSPVVIDGVLYQPIFDSTGQGETFEQGPLTQILAYKQGETDPGQVYKTYSPTMEEVGTGQFQEVGGFGDLLQTAAEDLAPIAAMALTAGGAGGLLGGALTGGALTGTGASALGNALISGVAGAISGQDPLKAALLAAVGTYGGGLFSGTEAASASTLTDAQFIAADAAQLAQQGLGAAQIELVLQASGVNAAAAIGAADAATSGLSVDQIADEITLGNRSLFSSPAEPAPPVEVQAPVEPAAVTTTPEGLQTVTTTGAVPEVVPLGSFSSPSSIAQPEIAAVMPSPAEQQITVTGTQQPVTLEDIITAIVPPQETVVAPPVSTPSVAPVVEPISTAPVSTEVVPPSQVVEVTGTQSPVTALEEAIAALVPAAEPVQALPPTVENPAVAPVQDVIPESVPPAQVIETVGTQTPETSITDAVAIPSAVTPQPEIVSAPLPPLEQQVTVTGSQQPTVTLEDILAAIPEPTVPAPEPVVPEPPQPAQVVEVTAPEAPKDNLAEAIAELTGPVEPTPTEPVLVEPPQPAQVVEVTAPEAPKDNLTEVIAELTGPVEPAPTEPVLVEPPQPAQVVEVTAPEAPKDNLAEVIAATVNPPVVQPPVAETTAVASPTAPDTQVVEITQNKPTQTIGDVAAAVNAGAQYGPGMTGTQTTVYDKVLETTGDKTAADTATKLVGSLTLTDILKALTNLSSTGLLSSGGGAGGGGGTAPMAPTTPVPVGNADYYKAIQQYYNTYMPAAPRDVATPLQQWYEGKFGG